MLQSSAVAVSAPADKAGSMVVALLALSVSAGHPVGRTAETPPFRFAQRPACVPRPWPQYVRPPPPRVRRESLATRHRPAVCSQNDRDSSHLQDEIKQAATVLRDLRAASTWEAKVVPNLQPLRSLRHGCVTMHVWRRELHFTCHRLRSVWPCWRGDECTTSSSTTGAYVNFSAVLTQHKGRSDRISR